MMNVQCLHLRRVLILGLLALSWACGEDASEIVQSPETCFVELETQSTQCTGVIGETYYCSAFVGTSVPEPKRAGSPQPEWVLQDVQPQSCGHRQFYGLEAFRGQPLLVVLLWSGCGFCQNQAEKLQQMHFELQTMGVEVNIVIVDRAADNPPTEKLTERCGFPIFQDEDRVNAWAMMQGRKDDFFFYDSNGVLKYFLEASDDIVLTNDAESAVEPSSGYSNIKNILLTLSAEARSENAAENP